MVKIGEKVPELEMEVFQKKTSKGEGKISKKSLKDYEGKWLVVLFYPADFTFVCPTELEDAADSYEEFKKQGAEILSISTDTAYVHKAWHDHSKAIGKITYPMGADPSGKVCRAFGTYIEDEGVSLRASFIINPKGILKGYEMHDNSIGRNIDEIFRKLQAAIYVGDHAGEVCPANWKPKSKTLKPGLDLVGKI